MEKAPGGSVGGTRKNRQSSGTLSPTFSSDVPFYLIHGGAKVGYSCEYTKQRVYSCIITYCIISIQTTVNLLWPHPVCIHLCICEFHRKVKVLFGAEMKEKPLKKSHWPRFHP